MPERQGRLIVLGWFVVTAFWLLLALGWLWRPVPAQAQDLSTDLANFLAAVHPRVTTTVDGATTFAVTGRFGWHYVNLLCTGAQSIDTITGGTTGAVLYLANADTDCTLNDDDDATAANAIDLTGVATNDVGAVKKMLVLIYNGTDWEQVSESDN